MPLKALRSRSPLLSGILQLSPALRIAAVAHPTPLQFRHISNGTGEQKQQQIALIGSGTIGLSFAALHLTQNPASTVTIFDPRKDLYDYICEHLPAYIPANSACFSTFRDRVTLAPTLKKAVEFADIVQEQGPEDEKFKVELWPEVEKHARSDALFWSSTSGIPASKQSERMKNKTRLMVVHPYNPPHIMPLLEVVPSPSTSQACINKTIKYWRSLGRTPVVIKKECTGFVANRLAFALFREACSLVAQGVVSVKDLDSIVTASMGPRWSVAGPFKSYHAGGGEGGMKSFMDKIGGTVQRCWDVASEDIEKYKINAGTGEAWEEKMSKQCEEEYGVVNTAERDAKTKKVLATAAEKFEDK
jgi:3-hydroxyacyl-CoA dehydrogenase